MRFTHAVTLLFKYTQKPSFGLLLSSLRLLPLRLFISVKGPGLLHLEQESVVLSQMIPPAINHPLIQY